MWISLLLQEISRFELLILSLKSFKSIKGMLLRVLVVIRVTRRRVDVIVVIVTTICIKEWDAVKFNFLEITFEVN